MLVRALCAWQPLSARDLDAHLGREDARDLHRTYLRPMIDGAELSYTILTMPDLPERKNTVPKVDDAWLQPPSFLRTFAQSAANATTSMPPGSLYSSFPG